MGARSRNHCSRGKALSVTYTECVFVGLVIKHAKRMRHIIICGLSSLCYIFPHYLIKGTIFEEKKSYWTQSVCFDFLYKFCLKHFSLLEELNEQW